MVILRGNIERDNAGAIGQRIRGDGINYRNLIDELIPFNMVVQLLWKCNNLKTIEV